MLYSDWNVSIFEVASTARVANLINSSFRNAAYQSQSNPWLKIKRNQRDQDNVYASVMSHADDCIGEVLATLYRLKLTDKTLGIFSFDMVLQVMNEGAK